MHLFLICLSYFEKDWFITLLFENKYRVYRWANWVHKPKTPGWVRTAISGLGADA